MGLLLTICKIKQLFIRQFRMLTMTSTQVLPAVRGDVLPEIRLFVLRDVAVKTFYFTLVASAFVFVSILITGVYP